MPDVRTLIEQAEADLRATTVTYRNWKASGAKGGRWGAAFAKLAEAKAALEPPPSPGLERKGYASGGSLPWYSPADRKDELDKMQAAGAKWCRFDMAWSAGEQQKGVYDLAAYDRTVDEILWHGMNVLAMIGYTPAWARPTGMTDKAPPVRATDYAAFCDVIAKRYRGRVAAYELWNEPNIVGFWQPNPSVGGPEKLAEMIRLAYTRIKMADSSATVVTGGLSPGPNETGDIDPRDYLVRLYDAGISDNCDAIGHHPYYGPSPVAMPKDWSTWSQMYVPKGTATAGDHGAGGTMSRPSLRQTMVLHGDGEKRIWATETNMKIQNVTRDGFTADEARQAVLVKEAFAAWCSYSFAGPFFLYNYRNHPGFSLSRPGGSLTPAYTAYKDAKE